MKLSLHDSYTNFVPQNGALKVCAVLYEKALDPTNNPIGGILMARYRVTNVTSPAESLRLAESGRQIANGESAIVNELTDGIKNLEAASKVTTQLLPGGPSESWEGIPLAAATTDATPTVAGSLETVDDKSYIVKAYVIAHRTGGGAGTANDSAAYELTYAVYNDAGSLTIVEIGRNENEDQVAFLATLVANGVLADLTVTGVVDNNVDWRGELEFFEA